MSEKCENYKGPCRRRRAAGWACVAVLMLVVVPAAHTGGYGTYVDEAQDNQGNTYVLRMGRFHRVGYVGVVWEYDINGNLYDRWQTTRFLITSETRIAATSTRVYLAGCYYYGSRNSNSTAIYRTDGVRLGSFAPYIPSYRMSGQWRWNTEYLYEATPAVVRPDGILIEDGYVYLSDGEWAVKQYTLDGEYVGIYCYGRKGSNFFAHYGEKVCP